MKGFLECFIVVLSVCFVWALLFSMLNTDEVIMQIVDGTGQFVTIKKGHEGLTVYEVQLISFIGNLLFAALGFYYKNH